jgi:dTDP-glucose 4,6-dehydratase
LSKKNFIVTGGYGFIGSCLIKELLKDKNISVCNIDKLSYSSSEESINELDYKNYSFERIDITETQKIKKIIQEFKPDGIFNLAAETHVDRSIDSPEAFIQSNINGTFVMLNESYKYWRLLPEIKRDNFRFIQVSTDEVYGSLKDYETPFNEESPYKPNSPYSASKAASDHLVRSWVKTYSFPAIITNTCNNYGPWQFPEKLIPLVISKCLKGEKIPVYGSGLQIRDWIRVEDHVSGLIKVFDNGTLGEKYNIGAMSELKNIEVIHFICDILDQLEPEGYPYRDLIEFVDDRPGHDHRYGIDNSKIKSLGWDPAFSWENGLIDVIEWYLKNKNFLVSKGENIYSGERLGKL